MNVHCVTAHTSISTGGSNSQVQTSGTKPEKIWGIWVCDLQQECSCRLADCSCKFYSDKLFMCRAGMADARIEIHVSSYSYFLSFFLSSFSSSSEVQIVMESDLGKLWASKSITSTNIWTEFHVWKKKTLDQCWCTLFGPRQYVHMEMVPFPVKPYKPIQTV